MRAFSDEVRYRLFAVLLGPLVIFPALIPVAFLITTAMPDVADKYMSAIMTLAVIGAYAYILFYCFPVVHLLRKYGKEHPLSILIFGALPAIVIAVLATELWVLYLPGGFVSVALMFSCWYVEKRLRRTESATI